MNAQVTHVTIKDRMPTRRPVMTVGRLFAIVPEDEESQVVFQTCNRVDEDGGSLVDEAETKVVRNRRRPQPKANEDAETK